MLDFIILFLVALQFLAEVVPVLGLECHFCPSCGLIIGRVREYVGGGSVVYFFIFIWIICSIVGYKWIRVRYGKTWTNGDRLSAFLFSVTIFPVIFLLCIISLIAYLIMIYPIVFIKQSSWGQRRIA